MIEKVKYVVHVYVELVAGVVSIGSAKSLRGSHGTSYAAAVSLLLISLASVLGCGRATEPPRGQTSCGTLAQAAAGWKRDIQAAGRFSSRQGVADRLLECDALVGRTKREIVRVLGQPQPYGTDFGGRPGSVIYTLGTDRGFIPLDDEHLLIDFDNGVAVSAEIVTD